MTGSEDLGNEKGEKPVAAVRERRGGSRRVLRGSSLLLFGRLLSVAVNFGVQVLAVRYLTKSDFGAFAWALAVASMGASLIGLGLQRGVARYVTIHDERQEYDEMFGTMGVAFAAIVGLGLALVVTVIGARNFLETHVVTDHDSAALLLILIALAPLQSLDNIFQGLLAIFAGARAIFFRRYILGPCLKLAAVLFVVAIDGSVRALAVSYLVAGILGTSIYVMLLWKVLARRGLLAKLHWRRIRLPVRRLMSFSLPLVSTDVMMVFETSVVVMLLERLRGTTEVAALRAVVPVAGLCLVTIQTLKLMFRPQAARCWARGDHEGLTALYWQSAAWVTVATFPVFAMCVTLSEPVTVLLFGEEYASSALLLAILAVGKYFNTAIGLNTFTLQTYGRVRVITLVNLTAAMVGLGLAIWLISWLGALGGAIATTAMIVFRNSLYQVALASTTQLGRPPAGALAVYGSVVVVIAGLEAVRLTTSNVLILVLTVVVGSGILLIVNRQALAVGDTFPELAKVPVLRRLL